METRARERCVLRSSAVVVVALALAAIVVGCTYVPPPQWTRPGAKPGEFESDRYACVKENTTTITSAAGDQSTVNQVGSNRTDWNMVDMCLQARGWQLQQAKY